MGASPIERRKGRRGEGEGNSKASKLAVFPRGESLEKGALGNGFVKAQRGGSL